MNRLGKYELLEEIGRGGFAVVYKARDTTLNRVVALKVLHPQLITDPKFVQRFHQEAQIAARLHHPHIVTIHEIGEEAGQHYLAMTFLSGRTLDKQLAEGPLPIEQTIAIVEQIADALDTIHKQGLVHRDIKPANIMVDDEGHATLLDFGIVRAAEGTRLTTTMAILGTPEYMAPEQAELQEDVDIDWRADVYTLGVVTYEMLVGRPPFTGKSPTAVLYKHVHEPPPAPTTLNPNLPAGLEPVLLKALAKQREERFQRAGDFAATLRRTLVTESEIRRREAQLTPLYRQLQAAAAGENWPEVLALGSQIQVLDASYRDVSQRMAYAREQLRYPRREPAQPPPAQPAQTPKQGISRRQFLKGALIVGGSVVGCGAAAGVAALVASQGWPSCEGPAAEEPTRMPTSTNMPTDTPTPIGTPVPPNAYNEAPMLAAKVDAGDLPPVDDRLPVNPRVIEGLGDELGYYSDEMRIGFTGTSPEWGAFLFISAWEHLVSWAPDFNSYVPNIAESIETNDDATEYIFYLREGLKWSDGVDYTADDIMFFIEDVMFNLDLSPAGPAADWLPREMTSHFTAEKIDDYTVKFIFPEPYGSFLYNLCGWPGRYFSMYPRHYLEQFHAKYNDDVGDLVEADGDVTDWMALFFKFGPDNWATPARWYQYPELPTLYPWVTTQPLGTGTQIRLERNPYYFKVDEAGNQLPYIDKQLGISYQDNESRTLAMLNGDLDFIKDPGDENRVLYHDAMDEGKPIQIKYPLSNDANTNTIHFNQTIDEPVKAEVFASKDFRIGMSHAINRSEIIEIVHNGQGEPAQHAPLNDSPFYIDGMDTQYLDYDITLANGYLDKVLPNKDAEGFRLGIDGKRFQIIFEVQNDLPYGTNYVQIAELLIGYWEEVGVEVLLNSIPGPQHEELRKDNLIEAIIFTGEGGAGVTPLLDPRYYIPMEFFGYFGLGWYAWRVPDPVGETVAVEPPQWAKDARAKYDEAIAQPTFELQVEKMREVIREAKDRFYVIGISRPGPMYYPFNARLGGIPETWYDGWSEGVQKILYPEQWFLKE